MQMPKLEGSLQDPGVIDAIKETVGDSPKAAGFLGNRFRTLGMSQLNQEKLNTEGWLKKVNNHIGDLEQQQKNDPSLNYQTTINDLKELRSEMKTYLKEIDVDMKKLERADNAIQERMSKAFEHGTAQTLMKAFKIQVTAMDWGSKIDKLLGNDKLENKVNNIEEKQTPTPKM